MNITRAKNQLFAAAMDLSPSSDEQFAFTSLLSQARRDGASDREICVALLGAMQDGIKYGNWPGTK